MELGGLHSVPSSAQSGSSHVSYVPKECHYLQQDSFRKEGEQEGACGYLVVTYLEGGMSLI